LALIFLVCLILMWIQSTLYAVQWQTKPSYCDLDFISLIQTHHSSFLILVGFGQCFDVFFSLALNHRPINTAHHQKTMSSRTMYRMLHKFEENKK
jgi:hypothetical protein